MKSYLVPTATAVIGFAIAWVAKPVGKDSTGSVKSEQLDTPARPTRTTSGSRFNDGPVVRPTEVRAGDFPLVELAESGPKTLEEAKMLRLTEALGLSVDQEGTIIQLVKDVAKMANMEISAIDEMTLRGNAIQEGLQKVLTAEQYAKFQEIQIRARENRTEVRAQRMLADMIEFIDLSPDQREQVASRLRQKAKEDLQAIPASASLLFNKSILPLGGGEISPEGMILLTQMGEKLNVEDPVARQTDVMNHHKQELEETLKCFDGILTSAQMAQYTASVAEKQTTIDRLRDEFARRNASIPKEAAITNPSPDTP